MKNFYPYKLPSDDPFHLETIPVFGTEERVDFFYKYKRSTENLYIGQVRARHLALRTSSDVMPRINDYLLQEQFLDETVPDDITKRLLPKICWLVDSSFKIGFIQPILAHYNPRIQKNVVHPGSIRSIIIRLFHQNSNINCMYFNTGGVDFDFMKSLQIITKDKLLSYKENIEIELVADHGSIIPHINLDIQAVKPNIKRWQEFVYRRLTSPTFTICCNHDIPILRPWYVDNVENANIEIIIDTPQVNEVYDDIICKAVILSIIGKSYSSPSITVKHKLTFSTPDNI
jgi:hypothetical protein